MPGLKGNLRSTNEHLSLALGQVRYAAEAILSAPQHRWYTDHTIGHSDRIIEKLEDLTAGMMRNKNTRLSPAEMYILLAAAYLHDIGMQAEQNADADLEKIRERHHELTAEMILGSCSEPQKYPALGLDPDETLVHLVALVAKSHRRGSLSNQEYDETQWGADWIRPRLLSALLRFGDELDIDHRRVILEKLKLTALDAKTGFHWYKCHYISGVRVADEYIKIHYRFPDDNYGNWLPTLVEDQIRKQFLDLQDIFREAGIRMAIGPTKSQRMNIRRIPAEVLDYGMRQYADLVQKELDEKVRKLKVVEQVSKAVTSAGDRTTEIIAEARREVAGLSEHPESTTPQDLAGADMRVNDLYSELLVGFVNREEEIQFLIQSVVDERPDFILVTAPADYGKSFLLRRVEALLRPKGSGRVLAWCELTSESTLETIIQSLLSQIVPGQSSTGKRGRFSPKDRLRAGLESALKRSDPIARGAVLLLDGVESLPTPVAAGLRQTLEAVNTDLWNQRRLHLRVILAVRYIPPEWEDLGQEYSLSPFTASVVGDAIDNMCRRKGLDPLPLGERSRLANEVHWTSGGHPAVMASILDELSQNSFQVTVDPDVRRRWFQEHGHPKISGLLRAVSQDLHAPLRTLGVFRWFNAEILSFLLREGEIQGFSGGDKLMSALRSAHLCGLPQLGDPGYANKTYRAPLLAELFFENPPRFRALNELAVQIHDHWLHGQHPSGEAMQRPPDVREQLWSLKELIYHLLLLDKDRGTVLAIVEGCLSFLVQGSDTRTPDFIHRFIGELEKDVEIDWAARQVDEGLPDALLGVMHRSVENGGQRQ
jgi:hypothetical protein